MKFFVVLFALAALANASLLRRKTFKLNDGTVIVRTDIEKHTTVIKPGDKAREILRGSEEDEDLEEAIPSIVGIEDVSGADRSPWLRMDKRIPLTGERIPNTNFMDEDLERDLMLRRMWTKQGHLIDDDSLVDRQLRLMLQKQNPAINRIIQTEPNIEDALERQFLINRDASLINQDQRDHMPWWMLKKISPAINIDDESEMDRRLNLMLRNDPTMSWTTKNVENIPELDHEQNLLLNMRNPMMNRIVPINPNIQAVSDLDHMLQFQKDQMFKNRLLQDQNLRSMDDESKTNNLPWFLLHKNVPMMNMMLRKDPSIPLFEMNKRNPMMNMAFQRGPGMDSMFSQPLRFKKTFQKFPWMAYASRKPISGM